MKKIYFIIGGVLLLCVSAVALIVSIFGSVQDMSSSENLFIVHVPESYYGNQPSRDTFEPTFTYTVRMLKDLHGERAGGETVSVSVLKQLTPGSRYLLAGTTGMFDHKPWLIFNRLNGATEIPSTFDLAKFDGQDIPTQISAILSARCEEIDKEINYLKKERESISRTIAGDNKIDSLTEYRSGGNY